MIGRQRQQSEIKGGGTPGSVRFGGRTLKPSSSGRDAAGVRGA